MKTYHLFLAICFGFMSFLGCQNKPVEEVSEGEPRQPKTSYGQSVHSAHEASKKIGARDQALDEQAKQLIDDSEDSEGGN